MFKLVDSLEYFLNTLECLKQSTVNVLRYDLRLAF